MPAHRFLLALRVLAGIAGACGAHGCSHFGPTFCGGHRFEQQPNARFRLTTSAKAEEPVTWKLDENADPDVRRSFGRLDIARAQERHAQLMMQYCLDRGFRPRTRHGDQTGYLTPVLDTNVIISPSTCVDWSGRRALAVRVWADSIRCTYVTPL